MRDGGGQVVHEHRPDLVVSTASVGKLLLLLQVARALPLDLPCDRRDVEPVADSGVWQHLRVDVLPAGDLAVLVAAVSDNLATNVLLHHVGLDRVAALAVSLGLTATALHDVVRDVRTAAHPPRLSSGSAAELSLLLHRLPSVEGGGRVLEWMRTSVDLSIVASAFGLDPLSHGGVLDPLPRDGVPEPLSRGSLSQGGVPGSLSQGGVPGSLSHGGVRGLLSQGGVTVRNKTGTDDGVRADVGVVEGPAGSCAYAVLANWRPGTDAVGEVLATMRELGDGIRALVGK